jgi:hypothetical protein
VFDVPAELEPNPELLAQATFRADLLASIRSRSKTGDKDTSAPLAAKAPSACRYLKDWSFVV